MDLELTHKIVVVTGGANGIGEATAQLFDREGATVILLDVDPNGSYLAASLANGGLFIQCDVSRQEDVATAFRRINDHFGRLDIVVNNAGIQTYGTVASTSEADWDRTLAVNLKSVFLCSQAALPLLLQAPNPVIINVASVQAFNSQEAVAAYATSKAGVLALTRSIAIDYAPKLRCVAVCPGAVDTPMFREGVMGLPDEDELRAGTARLHLLERIASAQEIADVIVFLASARASFTTGHEYRVDGGIGVKIKGK